MSPEHLFAVTNTIAVLSWLALALLPNRRWVADVLTGRTIPIWFAVLYAVIVATTFGKAWTCHWWNSSVFAAHREGKPA
jgi:hypothetical protein